MEKSILIVDDCDTTRRLLSYIVKSKGYAIISAINGIDALEKMATNEVELVLTDLNMPQMDGIELTRNIRDVDIYKEIPIIMITTEAGENDREQAENAGVTKYLTKPVTPDELIKEIESVYKN